MWPVVLCAIALFAVVAWRLLDLSVQLGRAHALLVRVEDLIGRGMLAEALAAARAGTDPAAHVVAAGVSRRSLGARRVAQAFRSAEVVEVAQLERGFVPLGMLATIAPLLGALSTVLALLESGVAWPAATLAPLGVGIGVAVAATVVHLWLGSRVHRFVGELRRATDSGVRLVARLDEEAQAGAPDRSA